MTARTLWQNCPARPGPSFAHELAGFEEIA